MARMRFMRSIRSLDLRFVSYDGERAFQAMQERELLRLARLGAALTFLYTLVHGASQNSAADLARIFACRPETAAQTVVMQQHLLWTLSSAAFGGIFTCRLSCGLFRHWNWELVVTVMMVYASCVVTIGQRYVLTTWLGEDPDDVWQDDARRSLEAWSLLGVNTMTTATLFFLPIRCIVSWLVPVVGILMYACFVPFVGFDSIVRTVVLLGLSYLGWWASWKMEKHRRIEWVALWQAEQSTQALEEIDCRVKETDEMAKCLLMVSRALCDTMVHLDSQLRILPSEELLFEPALAGRYFSELLSTDDYSRFVDCVHRARLSGLPELLPVSLHLGHVTSEVQVLLVARPSPDASHTYILGIRVERDVPVGSFSEAGAGAMRPVCSAPSSGMLSEEWDESAGRPPPPGVVADVPSPVGLLPGAAGPPSPVPAEGQGLSRSDGDLEAPTFISEDVPTRTSDDEGTSSASVPGVGAAGAGAQAAAVVGAGGGQFGKVAAAGAAGAAHLAAAGAALELAAAAPREGTLLSMRCIDENSVYSCGSPKVPGGPKPTPVKGRAKTLRMILRRWHVRREKEACCHYHTVLETIGEAVECLRQEPCEAAFAGYSEQCPRCLCMSYSHNCAVCGTAFVTELA